MQQPDNYRIDESFGSHVRFSDAKFFANLLEQHKDEKSDFHFDPFEPFVIGRDLKF